MSDADDIAAITQLIANERYDRDHRRWSLFRDAYFEDSIVNISWFKGTGPDFVAQTERRFADADLGMHFVSAVPVRRHGDRAVATVPLSIQLNRTWDGVPLFLDSVVIGFYGVERRGGRWGIRSFECSYVRDSVIPAVPGDTIPIDRALLEKFRPSYRFLSYSLAKGGYAINGDLPGVDRPELVKAIEDRLDGWARDGR